MVISSLVEYCLRAGSGYLPQRPLPFLTLLGGLYKTEALPSSFAQSVSICDRLISIKSLIGTCPYIILRRHVTGEPNPWRTLEHTHDSPVFHNS